MRLYEKYPDRIEYRGRTYSLDLDFSAVLASLDVLSESEISDSIKIETALDNLVLGRHPADVDLLGAIFSLLFPEKKSTEEPVIDFRQDADLILAAFRQAYGIDLKTTRMHWFEFSALLKGIPSGTRLAEVIDLRQREIPEPTKYNAKERAALIAAKAKVAIKKEGGLESGLYGIYKALEARAKGG